jgi:DNA repair protein RecO (recombination protein O)
MNDVAAGKAAPRRPDRQELEPALVLHAYPYRESSLIAEVFSRHRGRVALVARGARRPKSPLRGTLQAFQPLYLSWFGKSELRTLSRAEWQGGLIRLEGTALLCGFYLNELLLKLLAREDPHEALFDRYLETLHILSSEKDYGAALRRFEKHLLKELGYALILKRDVKTGEPIEPQRHYAYIIERGPVGLDSVATAPEGSIEVLGQTLLDIDREDYANSTTQAQSKALMRLLIGYYLGQKRLYTRRLLEDLHQK